MKKLILSSVFLTFFFSFHLAFASVVINEIMYNVPGTDTDHEWVEIYNDSSASVDLSGWKFNDGSNHNLNQPPTNGGQGSLTIPAAGYAIISGNAATFLSDHTGFSGTVIDTVMSLPNTSATLQIIKSDNSIADSVSYNSSQGANEDGNSLQKIGSSWVGAMPTPGIINTTSSATTTNSGEPVNVNNNNTSTQNGTTAQTSTTTETKSKTKEEPKIKVKITAKTLAFAGIPVELEASATGYSGEKMYYGKYFWNFGDGDSKEVKLADATKFTHTYFYEGEYDVSLEYYVNYYGNVPDAVALTTIKVVPQNISISRIGDEKDFFVELTNSTDYDADLSGWYLSSAGKSFTFARNTTLESKKKIVVSSHITHFDVSNKSTLKLMTSQGEVAFDYGAELIPIAPVVAIQPPKSPLSRGLSASPDKGRRGGVNDVKTVSHSENLPAAPILSDTLPANSTKSPYIPVAAGVVFIGTSASAAYYIRQKKIIPKAGDNFQILDE